MSEKDVGKLAHDIRNRLASMKSATEIALFDPSLPSAARQSLEQILADIDRIIEMVSKF